jgi:4-hydroxybenzoate polyprenyltransferase
LLPHINTYPLLIALTSTLDYRNFKKKFGNLKPIYIGIFWTLGCVILPSILISDDYLILTEPTIYLPSFFSMFASSNLLDIKDIDEDKNENINTIPVLYGENNAIIISHSALFISMLIFFQNENFYNNYFLSGLYELQIFSSFFLNYKKK